MHFSAPAVSDFKRLLRDQPTGQTELPCRFLRHPENTGHSGHPRRSVYISAEVSQSSWDSRSQPKSGHCGNKGQI